MSYSPTDWSRNGPTMWDLVLWNRIMCVEVQRNRLSRLDACKTVVGTFDGAGCGTCPYQ